MMLGDQANEIQSKSLVLARRTRTGGCERAEERFDIALDRRAFVAHLDGRMRAVHRKGNLDGAPLVSERRRIAQHIADRLLDQDRIDADPNDRRALQAEVDPAVRLSKGI